MLRAPPAGHGLRVRAGDEGGAQTMGFPAAQFEDRALMTVVVASEVQLGATERSACSGFRRVFRCSARGHSPIRSLYAADGGVRGGGGVQLSGRNHQ